MADPPPPPAGPPTDRLVGTAPAITALRTQIRRLAAFDAVGSPYVPTVLLQGETGTGKGLVARVLHDSGPRAVGPFIEVNCAAIPDTMLEAELFGFEPGAFTDARRAKSGLFEAASGGTLFLDEIDALPLGLQGKLLTAIESKRVRRLGAVTERAVDVKLIAATNAVLPEVMAMGRFRVDLYHRLAVVVLALPPLRERRADILLLAEVFLQQYTAVHGVPSKRLSAGAEASLYSYAWPGNVRELGHVMERVTLLHMGEEVDGETLMRLCQPLTATQVRATAEPAPQEMAAERALPAEAEQIRQALVQTGGNVARVARLLGVSRDTVRYRMQRHGIARPRLEAPTPLALPDAPGVGAGGSFPSTERHPAKRPVLRTPPFVREESGAPLGSAARPAIGHDVPTGQHIPTQEPAWAHTPVTVLAMELTWPAASEVAPRRYDAWTEMARWEAAIVDKVHGFGGTLVERAASLFVWVFGVPQMLEQLPQRAVHSALAIRQMIVGASISDMPPRPKVHLAVHLGAVQVDRQAADPTARVLAVGETLRLPVRLLREAEPGTIMVSPEVGRLVDGWVTLEARPLQLRAGDPLDVGGYAVTGVSSTHGEGEPRAALARTPFVGRGRELELLDALLEHVQAGRGQVVSVAGAPGMGKSRLLDEFHQHLSSQGVRSMVGQCLAYGSGIPYLPVLELLRHYCGITTDDRPEAIGNKVRASLQQVNVDPEASLPFLLNLLDRPVAADPLIIPSTEIRKAQIFATVRQLFLTSSQQQPLVLTVENLHWIDSTSEALLASLVEGLAGAAILLLATCRPGYRPPWLDKSYASHIALHPLGPDDSRRVVRHVMCDRSLTPVLEQQLLAKAEGNPFFLEELAHTVREHGARHPTLAVPDTIQAVLAARMERLPTAELQLLQTAAVIGKDIAVPLLQAIAELPEAALQHGLEHLQAAEFLHETRLFPEHAYTFKHALTQDVAYGSLLRVRRHALHARLVEALEALYPDRLTEQVERLAHHALRGEVWDKALAFCRQAGAKALSHSAFHEAVAYFEQALSALPHLPVQPETQAQAIDLRLDLRGALWPLGELARISVTLQEAAALAEALGDQQRLGWVSAALLAHFVQACEPNQAIAAGQRALALATALGDVGLSVVAQHFLGHVYRSIGDYHRAVDSFQNIIVILRGELLHEQFGLSGLASVLCRCHLSHALAERGAFTEAMTSAQEGVRLADAADHPYSRVLAYWAVGTQHLYKGDLRQAIPTLERALNLARAAHIHLAVPWIASFLGAAYVLAERPTDALPLLEQAVEQAMAMHLMLDHTCRVVWLGEAYLLAGRLDEAETQAHRALEFSRAHQERGHEACALRLLGEIASRQEPLENDAAEVCYRQALALAEKLGMGPLVAHCHLGLGRLFRQMERFAEAHAALSTAIEQYRDMDMTFWLLRAEAALAQLGRI